MQSYTRSDKKVFSKKPLAICLALIASNMAHNSFAQGLELEEIIVTAQKRVESLQDVPISVSAVSGEKLDKAGIENIEDLTVQIPNIHFTETGISTQVRVRGIGSDNSQGFEQSVGMYVDGIYYGRAQLFRTPMMDMERAELLRGPQSTLFGKNSIAGALNLTTARPTDEFEGRIAVSHEFETEQDEINAMVSGPLSDTFRARLAARFYQEEGYMQNRFSLASEPESEETAVRLSLEWDATDNLSLFFKAEQDQFDVVGRAIEITQDEVLPSSTRGLNYSQTLNLLGQPGFDAELDFVRDTDAQEFSNNEVNNYTFIAEYALGENTITAVTGALDFNYNEFCDCDFTAAELVHLGLGETYEQFSQELRIASPTGGNIDWLAGLFYQSYDQTFDDKLGLSQTNPIPLLDLNGDGTPGDAPQLLGTAATRNFEQNSDAWAIFARFTYHVSDRLHLTLGARYTEEEKTASKVINLVDIDSDAIINSPLLGITYANVFGVESEQLTVIPVPGVPPENFPPLLFAGHDVSGSRDESAFTPLINVSYDINSEMMAYASYTSGFKAGGFDPRSNTSGNIDGRIFNPTAPTPVPSDESNPLSQFEFEEETAQAFELGFKSTLADGRGELNAAYYHTSYEDLQISQFDGKVGFNVGNAKETVVQGIEIDGRWLLNENLTTLFGLSLLDFEYKDFKNGNCYAGQTPDGIGDIDGDGADDLCDYTGKRGVYTPEYTANLSFDYRRGVSDAVELVGFIDMQFVDGHQVHVNLDPAGEIDPYTMITARLGFEHEVWSIALLGKNLLDEKVISYSANAPLSDSTFNTNTYYSFVRRPRTVALEASYKF